jgi:hypothetical protein
MPNYLSTDPSAGLTTAPKYLSTDPSAGTGYLSTDPAAGLKPADEEQSLLGKVLAAPGAFGSAVRGGIKGGLEEGLGGVLSGMKEGFTIDPSKQVYSSDLLKDQGVLTDSPWWLRAGAGLALDVATDPLSYALFTKPIAAGLGAAAKLTRLDKGAKAVKQAVGSTALAQDLGKKFIPHFDAPNIKPLAGAGPTYREQRGLLQMRQEGAQNIGRLEGETFAKTLNPKHFEDIPDVLEGTFKGVLTPELQADAAKVKQFLEARATRETGASVLDPARLKQDYFTYLMPKRSGITAGEEVFGRQITAANRFNKERQLKSWAEAKAAGAETDLTKVLGGRASAGEKAAVTADWVGEMAKQFGTATKQPGFRPVKVTGIIEKSSLAKQLENVHFPEEVAADLERVFHLDAKKSGALGKMFDAVTGNWKALATRANPGFSIRNALSNAWLLSAAGMEPHEVINGLLRRALPRKGLDIAGKSNDEVVKLAQQWGVLGTGHLHELQGSERIVSKIPGIKQLGKAADKIENDARLTLFHWGLGKGLSPEQAALNVRKYLFNYNELTDTEKNIRRYAIPFYTWMRKSAPVVAESYLQNPKLWSRTNSLVQALQSSAKDAGTFIPDKNLPEYMRDDIQLNLGFTPEGGSTTMANPFPVTEVSKWASPMTNLGASLSPWLKVPAEYLTNKSLFTGGNIAPELQRGVEPSWAGPKAATAPGAGLVGAALGYPTFKGKQQVPVVADYALSQIPFVGPRVLATGTELAEGNVSGAVERIAGLTKTRDAAEVTKSKQRAFKQRVAENKAKQSIGKRSKSRLDELADRVGAM